ncbi:MAG: Obg family GTPase CgtA, partial [Candidatus Dormibacteria bacterium]
PGARPVVAMTGEGCRELLVAVSQLVPALLVVPQLGPAEQAAGAATEGASVATGTAGSAPSAPGGHRVYRHRDRSQRPLVSREEDAFRVTGRGIEREVEMTDLDSEEGVARLQRRMRVMGVTAALAEAGCVEGDTVRIAGEEFTFSPL